MYEVATYALADHNEPATIDAKYKFQAVAQ
jgi:hypothetical protein